MSLRLRLANSLDCRLTVQPQPGLAVLYVFRLGRFRCRRCGVVSLMQCVGLYMCCHFSGVRSYRLAVLWCKARSFLHIMWRACVSVCSCFSASKTSKKKTKKDGGVHCVVFSVASFFFSSFCNACTGNLIKFLVW